MNPNLQAIGEKYNYHLPTVIDQLINRYIKEILKDLSEKVPTLAVKVPTKLTMKQKKNEEDGTLVVERDARQWPQNRKDLPRLHQTLLR